KLKCLNLRSKKLVIKHVSDGLLHLSSSSGISFYRCHAQSRPRLEFQKHREASSPRDTSEIRKHIYSFEGHRRHKAAAFKNSLERLFLNNLLLREARTDAMIIIPLHMFAHHSYKKQPIRQQ